LNEEEGTMIWIVISMVWGIGGLLAFLGKKPIEGELFLALSLLCLILKELEEINRQKH